MSEVTARAARRPVAKKSGSRKTANRFASLAGGDSPSSPAVAEGPSSADGPEATGLIGAMSAAADDHHQRVVQLQVAEIAPHPFNDRARSQPQPDDPKWEELLNGVRANGVRLPVLVVPRERFLAARPTAAQDISTDARYVLVYGHRRRAAALEAGRESIPAVIDEEIMDGDGDLDAMASENLGRQDLSALAEADLFARYSDLGLSQRAIAARLGVNQATVSRRMALLLLAPELRQAVEKGKLPNAEAAALAGVLPYGPQQRWQKGQDPDQATEQRRAEQVQALRLITEQGWLGSRAGDRICTERQARAKAAEWGIPVVENPGAELGHEFQRYRVAEYTAGAALIAAINPSLGTLDLYELPAVGNGPDHTSGADGNGDAAIDDKESADPGRPHRNGEGASSGGPTDISVAQERAEAEAAVLAEKRRAAAAQAAAAQSQRRQACATLITQQVSNAELLKVLVGQYVSGVAARCGTSAVRALLREWDADEGGSGEKARNRDAWHLAVAAAELHTSELKDSAWDGDAAAHVQLLVDRVGYQPTRWERDQLKAAAR